MKYVNLTPHVVRLNSGLEIAPSGTVARVKLKQRVEAWIPPYDPERVEAWIPPYDPDGGVERDDGYTAGAIRIYRRIFDQVEGLPEPEKGTMYIVSGMVAAACRNREDVVAPATGHEETVRRDGQVWSVPGFSRG